MKNREGLKNVAASVHARLLNVARRKQEDFNLLLIRHALERFLYRLSQSHNNEDFVLKGASLFVAWHDATERPTRDLDLLAYGDPDISRLEQIFRNICSVDVEPDGVSFDPSTVHGFEIREGAIYDGVRINLVAALGNARTRVQIDIGFGDAVVPSPELIIYPTILDQSSPKILAYPPEAVIAEKFHAMVDLGLSNSRLKDYFDIWQMLRVFEFEYSRLSSALKATFARRNTALPTNSVDGLSQEYADRWSANWGQLVDRFGFSGDAPTLEEVIHTISEFLAPVYQDQSKTVKWIPGKGWR